MPHSVPVPNTGIQALILCGPGVSLNTFTSNEDSPKALVPIANRPMIYYPLDWCYRMGITNITIITPSDIKQPLESAMGTNPYLTSLPSPSPSILSPPDLTMTTGTAELLRLPEVQSCIKSDFLLLPCDLICDIPGESFIEAWMAQSALGGSDGPKTVGLGGGSPRGGLAMFYQTKGQEESVKGEATDFVATVPLEENEAPAVSHPLDGPAALRFGLSKLALSMPMDTLKENMQEQKGLLIRHSLVKKHPRIKLLTSFRDANCYLFPYWVSQFSRLNEPFESISEDLVGWWAKAGWQTGLGEKLHLREILQPENKGESGSQDGDSLEDEIDLNSMISTKSGAAVAREGAFSDDIQFASRVQNPDAKDADSAEPLHVPPILAYMHSSKASAPLVRRVDSSALLLSVSLKLAKLEAIEEVGRVAASPFAHNQKINGTSNVAQRCTVTKADCLIDMNTTINEKSVVKESVIGANCVIGVGARLTRCLVMDGAVIGERAQLSGCIIGRRSKIGRECVLKDCEVQDGNVVEDDTEAKNEKFMVFEGLDDDQDMDGGDYEDDQDDF
ncbi:putative eukaryotic translation initiation factor subunit eIF2B-gamma [Aspergillus violaceofuscus CBS 115571]|uniref:Translation initiation factor eIF2B subunit gamma n=1 Tax=Aspergillus violaceofuscus (strain CBS 115571) TaxID=1450538 RepID=A0A2V5HH82_ASPV1|nr:putative eukaryotic translation initiation factor subunit eIF2B-gamma [Aspergillus violaceofuscus CBS 115571]